MHELFNCMKAKGDNYNTLYINSGLNNMYKCTCTLCYYKKKYTCDQSTKLDFRFYWPENLYM